MASTIMNFVLTRCGVSQLRIQQLTITRKAIFQLSDSITDILVLKLWIELGPTHLPDVVVIAFALFLATISQFYSLNKEHGLKIALAFGVIDISPLYYTFRAWCLDAYSYAFEIEVAWWQLGHCLESIASLFVQFYILVAKMISMDSVLTPSYNNGVVHEIEAISLGLSLVAVVSNFVRFSVIRTCPDLSAREELLKLGTAQYDVPMGVFVLTETMHRMSSVFMILILTGDTAPSFNFIRSWGIVYPAFTIVYTIETVLASKIDCAKCLGRPELWVNSVGSMSAPVLETFALFASDDDLIRHKMLPIWSTFIRQLFDLVVGVLFWFLYPLNRPGFRVGNPRAAMGWLICHWGCVVVSWLVACLQLFYFGTSVKDRLARIDEERKENDDNLRLKQVPSGSDPSGGAADCPMELSLDIPLEESCEEDT